MSSTSMNLQVLLVVFLSHWPVSFKAVGQKEITVFTFAVPSVNLLQGGDK